MKFSINYKSPDWLVIVALAIPAFIMGSVNLAMSLFFKPLQLYFGWTRVITSSGFIAYSLCLGVAVIAVGYLLDKYGYRPLTLIMIVCTGGGIIMLSRLDGINQFRFFMAITGLGTGACFVAPSTVAQQWFSQQRGRVLGIISASMGAGLATAPPIINHFIYAYSWQTAYFLLGIFAVISITVSVFLLGDIRVRNPAHNVKTGKIAAADTNWKPQQAIRTSQFLAIAIGGCLQMTSLSMVTVHIVAMATDGGISPGYAAAAISGMGILAIPTRILLGKLVQKFGWYRLLIASNIALTLGIALLINLGDSVWRFFLAVGLIGVGIGMVVPAIPGLLATYFGLQSLGTIIGINQGVTMIISGVFGPYMGGVSYDMTQSYFTAFIIAVCLMLTSFTLFLRARHAPVMKKVPVTSPAE